MKNISNLNYSVLRHVFDRSRVLFQMKGRSGEHCVNTTVISQAIVSFYNIRFRCLSKDSMKFSPMNTTIRLANQKGLKVLWFLAS